MALRDIDVRRLEALAEKLHLAGFAEGVADANGTDEDRRMAESAAARASFASLLAKIQKAQPTEMELHVKAKRRSTKGGQLVTLARDQLVRVTLRDDSETVEIYAEQSMIVSMPTGNVVQIKLRNLNEVE